MTVLNEEGVTTKLREFSGNMAATARFFGVTRQAVQHFVKNRPELRDVVQDTRESMKDNAESVLYKAVLAGEAWAICFYLKCQAKDRGYIEKTQTEITTGASLQIVEEIVDGPLAQDGATPPDADGIPPG